MNNNMNIKSNATKEFQLQYPYIFIFSNITAHEASCFVLFFKLG